jgi:hypothetical protein
MKERKEQEKLDQDKRDQEKQERERASQKKKREQQREDDRSDDESGRDRAVSKRTSAEGGEWVVEYMRGELRGKVEEVAKMAGEIEKMKKKIEGLEAKQLAGKQENWELQRRVEKLREMKGEDVEVLLESKRIAEEKVVAMKNRNQHGKDNISGG